MYNGKHTASRENSSRSNFYLPSVRAISYSEAGMSEFVMLDCELIKTLRERQMLTMQEAATKAGFGGRQSWNDIESGRRANIKLATLFKIAEVLGVPARSLIREPPKKK